MPVGFPLALILLLWTQDYISELYKISSFYMQIQFQEFLALQNRTGKHSSTFSSFSLSEKDRQAERQIVSFTMHSVYISI